VLSKPVGRAQFLVAKYAGVLGALTVLTYCNLVTTLLASRMAFDAYGDPDTLALGIFFAAIAVAYLMGGFSNFFLHRPFVSDAVISLVLMATLAFIAINFFNKEGAPQDFAVGIDWRLVPASLLLLFAVWTLAALALACSTRLDTIPTLAVCSALFLVGIMSDYLFGRPAVAGSWWATTLYALVPNWQLFWLADALDVGKTTFHWGYVGKALAYMVAYVGATLGIAVLLFEERELS
jgi:ABC-type transport system involved in multi-copper enzyme maturation permease subunit